MRPGQARVTAILSAHAVFTSVLMQWAIPASAQEISSACPQAASDTDPCADSAILVLARRSADTQEKLVLRPGPTEQDVAVRDGFSSLRAVAPDVGLFDVNATQSSIAMRGATALDESASADPSVAIYVDDFYLGRGSAARLRIPDLAGISVARGPQGTGYGRNALGGAVNFITAGVERDRMTTGRLLLDSELALSAGLVANLPFDNGGVRIGAYGVVSNGGYRNELTGSDLGGRDELGLFAKWQVDVGDDKNFWLSATLQVQRSDTEARFLTYNVRPALPAEVVNTDDRVFQPLDPRTRIDLGRIVAKYGHKSRDADGFQLILGLQNVDANVDNNDFAPGGGSARIVAFETDDEEFSTSAELRGWRAWDGLKMLGGLLVRYADTTRSEDFILQPAPGSLAAIIFGGAAKRNLVFQTSKNWELSGFVSLAYEILPSASVELGGRYTFERKNGTTAVSGDRPSFLLQSNPFSVVWKDNWQAFTPSAKLVVALAEDASISARWARGFKAGGFTNSANNPNTALASFGPEFADTFEAGLHLETDRPLWFELNLFYTKYRDLQTLLVRTDPKVGVLQEVVNAGRSRSRGFEAMARYNDSALTSTIFLSYIDARYTEFSTFNPARGILDFSGERVPLTPKWSFRVELAAPDSGWTSLGVRPGVSVSYRSKVFFFPDSSQSSAIFDDTDFFDLGAWIAVPLHDRGELRLSASNLLDQRPYTFANTASSSFYYSLAQVSGGAILAYGSRQAGRRLTLTLQYGF